MNWEVDLLFNRINVKLKCAVFILSNASINSSSAHPPPPRRGNCGAFAHVVSPGGGVFAILSRLGVSVHRGDPRAFDTSVKAMTSREKNVADK